MGEAFVLISTHSSSKIKLGCQMHCVKIPQVNDQTISLRIIDEKQGNAASGIATQ